MRATVGLAIFAVFSGCGGGSSGAAGTGGAGGAGGAGAVIGSGGAQASFEPLAAGATWSYSTTDTATDGGTASGTKIVTVERTEPVPGATATSAWRIHTVVPGSDDQLTWQDATATAIVRYRDDVYTGGGTTNLLNYDVYAPSKLRIDTTAGHLVTGAMYSETYTDTFTDLTLSMTTSSSKPFSWLVVNAAEQVTVPAGTFSAVHLRKLNANSNKVDKDYWFVRGVGKVKETSSAGRTEVLTAYNIP